MRTLSPAGLQFTFTGRAAQAAVSPHEGVNTLDAAVLTLNAIGLLCQQLPSDVRVHAIIAEGGEAQNIIPERTVLQASVRAEYPRLLLDDVQVRVENCARGAALATATEVEVELAAPTYRSIQPNPVLEQIVEESYARIGRPTEPHREDVFAGSTEMGNVSQDLPTIHPNIEIVPGPSACTAAAPPSSSVGRTATVQ